MGLLRFNALFNVELIRLHLPLKATLAASVRIRCVLVGFYPPVASGLAKVGPPACFLGLYGSLRTSLLGTGGAAATKGYSASGMCMKRWATRGHNCSRVRANH